MLVCRGKFEMVVYVPTLDLSQKAKRADSEKEVCKESCA
jgi:hypothetical protein